MPVMNLQDTEPTVREYMDTMAGSMCYTYTNM